mmetsp:Transcript_78786/g.189042  ORF Transcript_78786/g.189042 Transcript_78786/m.189042 type:complete len:233 (-) Transcript_78786:941-1639(-)
MADASLRGFTFTGQATVCLGSLVKACALAGALATGNGALCPVLPVFPLALNRTWLLLTCPVLRPTSRTRLTIPFSWSSDKPGTHGMAASTGRRTSMPIAPIIPGTINWAWVHATIFLFVQMVLARASATILSLLRDCPLALHRSGTTSDRARSPESPIRHLAMHRARCIAALPSLLRLSLACLSKGVGRNRDSPRSSRVTIAARCGALLPATPVRPLTINWALSSIAHFRFL